MKEVKEQQEQFPDAFEVYSFNLDELPDAGEKLLRERGLNWHAMHVPDGRRNVSYQAYGAGDPVALFVNGFGYTVLNPFGVNPDSHVGVMSIDGGMFKISEARLSHERYLAQLQMLFIGDFLVWDDYQDGPVPVEVFKEIQQGFVYPPFRYRLSKQEALANYTRAETLCGETIEKYAGASNLWQVRNRRIIALLGLWNLKCELRYLEQAAAESKVALSSPLPAGAEVVPQFCLAKIKLRNDAPDVAQILADLVESTSGDQTQPSALAAAAILALVANDRSRHEVYRTQFLDSMVQGNAVLQPVVALLRDRYHRFHLLEPNSTGGDRLSSTRYYIVNHDREPSTERFPDISLKRLDGQEFRLPDAARDRLTLLLFVEPPADPSADFPVHLDRSGKPTQDDHIRKLMNFAHELAAQHVNKSVDIIAAFLCDDPTRVEGLMKTNAWTCQATMVPGGLTNPMVHKLGILSADHVPNIFLLRRDGSIAWHTSGFVYKAEFGYPFALLLGMKVHIEVCEAEHGYQALLAADYGLASRTFAGPFPPAEPDRYGWLSPQFHGRAVAQMGAKDWAGALESINSAIDAHTLRHLGEFGLRRREKPLDWRLDAAPVDIKNPCDIYRQFWNAKVTILNQLGRTDEAALLKKRLEEPFRTHGADIYGVFHEKLSKVAETLAQ